jgi:LacI family transcriptional regulator
MGHTRIGLVTVPLSTFSGRARLLGYKKAFADTRLKVDPDLIRTAGYDAAYALDSTYSILSAANAPSAIIASGGLLGGVLEATRQLHLKVPDHLSLVALGDTELAAMTTPPVTAVRYDWAEAGHVAARLVIRRIGGHTAAAENTVVPYSFMIRQSCEPPAGKR